VSVADVAAGADSPGFLALSDMAAWLDAERAAPGKYMDLTQGGQKNVATPELLVEPDKAGTAKTSRAVTKLQAAERRAKRDRSKLDELIAKSADLPDCDLRRNLSNEGFDVNQGLVQGTLGLDGARGDK
jgi:hypothetical protein